MISTIKGKNILTQIVINILISGFEKIKSKNI